MSLLFRNGIPWFSEENVPGQIIEPESEEGPAKHDRNPLRNVVNVGVAQFLEAEFYVHDRFCHYHRYEQLKKCENNKFLFIPMYAIMIMVIELHA